MYNKNFIATVGTLKMEHPTKQISNELKFNKGTISSYLSGSIKASKPFLEKFANYYKISQELLKDGDEDNDKSELPTISKNLGAPYYDVDFIGGFDLVINDQNVKPRFYINFLPFNDVDCWVNITGKSMSPFISHGDIVALKKIDNWNEFLLYGEIYAIVSEEFRTVKIIGQSEKNNCFKLIPYSKSPEFSEQDMPKKLIQQIYRVKGSLKKFF